MAGPEDPLTPALSPKEERESRPKGFASVQAHLLFANGGAEPLLELLDQTLVRRIDLCIC